jgi:transcriptional regulator with XRE-family HTH domain
MDIKSKIGGRIRELRNDRDLSQEKFANLCGLDRTYIAGIEQGRRNVSIVNLEKIAKAFGISLSEFFKGL